MGATESKGNAIKRKQKYRINGKEVDENTFDSKQINGLYQRWYSNGKKWIECTYIDRKLEGLFQHWYYEGNKLKECTYIGGKQNGVYTVWHSNGNKMLECNYINGKIHGTYEAWYDNKNKEVEYTYVNGKLHGTFKTYDKEGQLIKVVEYVNGVEQKKPIDNQLFKRYIQMGLKDLAAKESLQCGICYEDLKDKVVVFSCCSLTLCDSGSCLRSFESCPQCRSEKPQTMLVALG